MDLGVHTVQGHCLEKSSLLLYIQVFLLAVLCPEILLRNGPTIFILDTVLPADCQATRANSAAGTKRQPKMTKNLPERLCQHHALENTSLLSDMLSFLLSLTSYSLKLRMHSDSNLNFVLTRK